MTAAAADAALGLRVFDDLMRTFFLPEIERRQDRGCLARPANLRSAQVVLHPDGRPSEVRLNEEVKCVTLARKGRSTRASARCREATRPDVGGIELMDMADAEHPDWAHATIVLVDDRWQVFFDFPYNKSLAHRLLGVARQFLRAAVLTRRTALRAPCIDNLYSAAELAVRAELLLAAYPGFRKRASHREIRRRFEVPAKPDSEPVGPESVFVALMESPYPERYLRSTPVLEDTDLAHLLRVVNEMIAYDDKRMAIPANHGP